MENLLKSSFVAAAILCIGAHLSLAQALDPAVQSKVDAMTKEIQAWAAAPAIVDAVKAYNAAPPADAASMTQEKWKTTPILDPFVRGFTKNPAADFLKGKKTDATAEAFLSAADGRFFWVYSGKRSSFPQKNRMRTR